jgi:NitT/TauT family transport system permease protein/sulfonate transport system permease protein
MTLGAGGDVVVRQTPAQPTNAANRTADAKSLDRSPSIAEVSTPSLLLSVRFIVPCLGLAALLVLWTLLSWSGAVNELLLPSPLAVLKAGTEEAANGVLVDNILISVKRVLTGYSLAVAIGVGLGLFVGWNDTFYKALNPAIEALRPIPPIAWVPLAILWFGLTDRAAYYIVFIGPVFPIFVTTAAAVRATGRHYVNAAQCLGANDWALLTQIIFPGALPEIVTALRVGIAVAWTCVVAAELVAAQSGLGYQMWQSRELFKSADVIFGMAMIGALGFASNYLIILIERRVLRWHRGTVAR